MTNEDFVKLLPFYNVLLDIIKKPKVKVLTNGELLSELPFYKSLTTIKEISNAFKRYTRSFKTEIVDKNDAMMQLYASKSSIKDLFNLLLK